MSRFLAVATALAAAGTLSAQDDRPAPPAQAPVEGAAELARTQRALNQNRGEIDRLLDLRIRHDLGLPVESEAASFRPDGPVTSEGMERSRLELREQEATTSTLLERYRKLKAAVEQLRAESAAQQAAAERDRSFVVVPQAGAASTGARLPERGSPANGRGAPPAVLAGEAGPDRAAAPPQFHGLDPIRGQIHGSEDHLRVAQALFKAGQDLMDRGATLRSQGEAAAAAELELRAKERLGRALEELQPLLAVREPAFPVLFYQGRCLELLFRYSELHEGLSIARSVKDFQQREAEVRKPFVAISARDVTRSGERGEVELLGRWGLAAQTAMEHFRWMNLHGGYRPQVSIESLTWPGEKNP